MDPKETTEYIKLRGAAIMYLEYQKELQTLRDTMPFPFDSFRECLTRLDAARSVLWDVINDKDLTKQS